MLRFPFVALRSSLARTLAGPALASLTVLLATSSASAEPPRGSAVAVRPTSVAHPVPAKLPQSAHPAPHAPVPAKGGFASLFNRPKASAVPATREADVVAVEPAASGGGSKGSARPNASKTVHGANAEEWFTAEEWDAAHAAGLSRPYTASEKARIKAGDFTAVQVGNRPHARDAAAKGIPPVLHAGGFGTVPANPYASGAPSRAAQVMGPAWSTAQLPAEPPSAALPAPQSAQSPQSRALPAPGSAPQSRALPSPQSAAKPAPALPAPASGSKAAR